jgi:hypothetical protein
MFPIDEAAIWARRDAVLTAQQTEAGYPLPARSLAYLRDLATLARAAVASSDDVPKLLDALVQVYGDLLSERHAIDETTDATDGKLGGAVWARYMATFERLQHHD